MKRLTGIGASRGVAIGKVHFIDNVVKRVECDTVVDTVLEMERFEEARLKAIEMLEELHQKAKNTVGPEESIIFEIHQLLLRDNDYVNSVHELIAKSHYSAAYAAQQTGERFAQMFSAMEDAYLRERSADMIDISSRVVRLLQGEAAYDVSQIKGQIIIAAKDLLPSETIQLDRDRVLGFVTSGGSQVSHSSILARTMGIPSVIGLGDQLAELVDGDMIVLDGFNGVLIANPPDKLLKDYHCKQAEYQLYRERLQTLKGVPSRTQDGVEIEIYGNIGHPSDVDSVLANDGQGVGLFRTEFLYMEYGGIPSEQTQFEAYRSVLERMNGRRVVVRTLDLGADKAAPGISLPAEENPALGYRALRICLKEQALFKTQLRALLRAALYGHLAIMFPMVISLDEIRQAKELVEICREELEQEGIPYGGMELGIMIETPAAALLSDLFAPEVDFFSIGTNDLTQYTLAVDRMNMKVGDLYDPRNPAVLRLVQIAAESARRHGIWCGICGESAADRRLTEHYLRMGVTELSVTPASILEMREKVLSINLSTEKEHFMSRV